MLVLDESNTVLDTDSLNTSIFYSVLRMKEPKYPDFYFEQLKTVEEFTSNTMKLDIGGNEVFVPFHWSILCTDYEYIQTIPLSDLKGPKYQAFAINPIDGFMPHYPVVRMVDIYQNATWSCPPIHDKDLLVVPIGPTPGMSHKGPLCVIMTPHKIDINRPLSDIM